MHLRRQAKVLHLITRLIVGGAQDNTLLTVQKHDRNRFLVHLASNPNGAWHGRAVEVSDDFHPLPSLINPIQPLQDLKAFWDIYSLIRQEKFDIVHTHSSKAGILGRFAARLAGVPVIVHTVHSFPFHDFMPPMERQFYIGMERCYRSFADFYITVSELNRSEACGLNIFRKENSQTIYSGIDFSKFDRPSDPKRLRQDLEIPDDWQTIAMIGRLDPQKAPHYLIEAFSKVCGIHPKTMLLLVGEGELEGRLKVQTQQLGIADRVKFLGTREDVPEILKAVDIFSLSSLWEGLGRSMTEAMLLGKPVVVPDIYGIPEIVHHNETGLLFRPGDVDHLAAHLNYLLESSSERDRLGQNAKKLTREIFDANVMVQKIEEIYEKLLSMKTKQKKGQFH